jgi:hypothetical protein
MEFTTFFGLGFLGFMVYEMFQESELVYVKSNIDGKQYQVRNLPDKQQAADLMAKMNQKILQLIQILQRDYPEDEKTKQITKNYREGSITESLSNSKYTSYAVNKGEKIVFCIRDKDEEKKIIDENLMTFVTMHELSHLGTKSIGHTPEFWDNFKFVLEVATKNGLYQPVDYSKKPVEYCGMKVTTTPLDVDAFRMNGTP